MTHFADADGIEMPSLSWGGDTAERWKKAEEEKGFCQKIIGRLLLVSPSIIQPSDTFVYVRKIFKNLLNGGFCQTRLFQVGNPSSSDLSYKKPKHMGFILMSLILSTLYSKLFGLKDVDMLFQEQCSCYIIYMSAITMQL